MEKGPLWLKTVLNANGLLLNDSQCTQLEQYCTLLLEWNRKVNLISRKSEHTVWEEQILHSVSFLTRIQMNDSASVIDVGTGGGLPGIPLKILMPSLSMTLVDSIRKKIVAVQSIIQELKLEGIETVCSRAEEFHRNTKGKKFFNYVVCRGVGQLVDLWEYGYPLLLNDVMAQPAVSGGNVKQGAGKISIDPGAIIALKGGDVMPEVRNLERKKNIAITVIDINLDINEPLANSDKKVVVLRPL